MNDELKEIINNMKEISSFEYTTDWFELNYKDTRILLDYITNLQERIDKAIEYIENLPVMFYPDDFYEINHKEIEWDRTELLDILKGDSDE